jgi:hypothetical protein
LSSAELRYPAIHELVTDLSGAYRRYRPALKVAFDKVLAAENFDFLSLLIAEAIAGDLREKFWPPSMQSGVIFRAMALDYRP